MKIAAAKPNSRTAAKAAFLGALALLVLASCAPEKPAEPPLGAAREELPSATAEGAPVVEAKAASPQAERPWYAARLESLGFYVFPEPVGLDEVELEPLSSAADAARRLSDLKGKVVLLNFWATWCPPCRLEIPSIAALGKALKGEAFEIAAVSVGEERKTVADFVAQEKLSFPVYLDRSGKLGAEFGARSIPTTYILDREGRIVAGYVGSRQYDGPETVEALKELARR